MKIIKVLTLILTLSLSFTACTQKKKGVQDTKDTKTQGAKADDKSAAGDGEKAKFDALKKESDQPKNNLKKIEPGTKPVIKESLPKLRLDADKENQMLNNVQALSAVKVNDVNDENALVLGYNHNNPLPTVTKEKAVEEEEEEEIVEEAVEEEVIREVVEEEEIVEEAVEEEVIREVVEEEEVVEDKPLMLTNEIRAGVNAEIENLNALDQNISLSKDVIVALGADAIGVKGVTTVGGLNNLLKTRIDMTDFTSTQIESVQGQISKLNDALNKEGGAITESDAASNAVLLANLLVRANVLSLDELNAKAADPESITLGHVFEILGEKDKEGKNKVDPITGKTKLELFNNFATDYETSSKLYQENVVGILSVIGSEELVSSEEAKPLALTPNTHGRAEQAIVGLGIKNPDDHLTADIIAELGSIEVKGMATMSDLNGLLKTRIKMTDFTSAQIESVQDQILKLNDALNKEGGTLTASDAQSNVALLANLLIKVNVLSLDELNAKSTDPESITLGHVFKMLSEKEKGKPFNDFALYYDISSKLYEPKVIKLLNIIDGKVIVQDEVLHDDSLPIIKMIPISYDFVNAVAAEGAQAMITNEIKYKELLESLNKNPQFGWGKGYEAKFDCVNAFCGFDNTKGTREFVKFLHNQYDESDFSFKLVESDFETFIKLINNPVYKSITFIHLPRVTGFLITSRIIAVLESKSGSIKVDFLPLLLDNPKYIEYGFPSIADDNLHDATSLYFEEFHTHLGYSVTLFDEQSYKFDDEHRFDYKRSDAEQNVNIKDYKIKYPNCYAALSGASRAFYNDINYKEAEPGTLKSILSKKLEEKLEQNKKTMFKAFLWQLFLGRYQTPIPNLTPIDG